MAVRRGGIRAIRALCTQSYSAAVAVEVARPLQQLPLQLLFPRTSGSNAWGSHWSHAAPYSPYQYARHVQTSSERPAEEQHKVLPDAEECDTAIENYAKVRLSYKDNLRLPSTYRTASQRVMDVLVGAWNVVGMVVSFTLSIPGRLWALRLKSREDWARSWANVKKTVKEEAHHYWVGCKLLAYDVRVASGLVMKALRGNQLTWRERRQLTRTTADMFRLVPMIIIVAVPFMELALPLLLKLFPNMLPSTFEDKLKKEEQIKQRLVVKMEVARFLQDTVAEMAKEIKSTRSGSVSGSAEELYSFINRIRAGAPVSNQELVKFASLFNDELTLDNLDRVQLVSMCQLLSIPPYGTDGFLKQRMRSHLEKIRQEDRLIQAMGLDNLTVDELRSAVKTRGMRAMFGPGAEPAMKQQMQSWLELSLNHGLPSSLLLLSRAFTLSQPQPGAPAAVTAPDLDNVKDTLLTLPEEVIKDVGLEVAAPASGAEELEKRLHLLQKEQKLIQAEAAAKKLEVAAAAAGGAAATPATGAAVAAATASPLPADVQADAAAHQATAATAAATAAAAAVLAEAGAAAAKDVMASEGISREELAAQQAAAREEKMQEIVNALAVLACQSGVAVERAKFMDLVKREVQRLHDTKYTDASATLLFTGGTLQAVRPEELPQEVADKLRAPERLEERVSGILMRIEQELDAAEKQIGSSLRVMDLDNDGLISFEELEQAMHFLRANLDKGSLDALLARLELASSSAQGSHAIPVADLLRMAQEGSSSSGSGSSSSSSSGSSGSRAPAATPAPLPSQAPSQPTSATMQAADGQQKDSAKIHVM